jgi:hypothetical protein
VDTRTTAGIVRAKSAIELQSEQFTATMQKLVPDFRSLEEEAEFWDTHDSTEFEGEFEEVEEEMQFVLVRPYERWIPLVLVEQFMTVLEERARKERVDTMTLIQNWVWERLKER